MKLKLISRQANINFKFAKRLQDNQHVQVGAGSRQQAAFPAHLAPHLSAQLELESPMESQKGSTRFLQLISHR